MNKLAVVFYCWAINDWRQRTTSSFERIFNSGLYDCADELFFLVADTEGKKEEIEDFAKKFPKFKLEYHNQNLGSEYRGIKKVEEIGNRKEEYNILYLHAKGVYNKYRNLNDRADLHELKINGINCWSEMLTYFVVDKWRDCVNKLNEGFDTAGAACHYRWWWGNFWWASSKHIKRLRKFEGGSRWNCEAWLHEARDNSEWESIKFFEQNKFRYNPYYTVIPRYMYEEGDKSDIVIKIKKAEYGFFGEQINEGQPPPQHQNTINVTDKIKEISPPNKIIYPKAWLEQFHSCDGEKSMRVYFSTSREPNATYVVTTHPYFDDISFFNPPELQMKGIL
jgi:hypothetical protein